MVKVEPYEADTVSALEKALNVPHLIARILHVRGITTPQAAERFLYPRLDHLSDPFLLPDVVKGVTAVVDAVKSGKKIGLFGDYDADGITSTALMINFLAELGVTPEVCIPGREEGYGLNTRAIETLKDLGVSLLICLDCGSSNNAEIEAAHRRGLQVIVIDHHELGAVYPDALAVINPKRKDSMFPTVELAACGVTFFFLLALRRTMDRQGLLKHPINLKRELDLVAVGTVADMVPLNGDNRVVVRFGMETMQLRPRRWLQSFFARNLVAPGKLDQYALSFVIIPRINAAGRVSDPRVALDFLISREETESGELLHALDRANRQRQNIEETILRQAVEKIEDEELTRRESIVLHHEDWPIGVIGIVAQKVAENYGKPCVIITRTNGTWKGSARGVEGLDLHQAVSKVSPLLLRFGGHKFACGLSVAEENIVPFADAFEDVVKGCIRAERTTSVDAAVEFEEVTDALVRYIEMLAPFGIGNPRPNLLLRPLNVSIKKRFVKLTDDRKRTWYGNIQRRLEACAPGTHIVACPSFREEMGEKFIQFHIKEFVTG